MLMKLQNFPENPSANAIVEFRQFVAPLNMYSFLFAQLSKIDGFHLYIGSEHV